MALLVVVAAARAHREVLPQGLHALRANMRVGDQVQQLAVEPADHTVGRIAEPHRASGDRVEDRLDVGGRAGDDPQDLAGGRLLLEGLGQVAVLRLQLREQADVLDGDDGLVGEGRHQVDLLLGEGPDVAPPHDQGPDGFALAEERHGQHGAIAEGGLLNRRRGVLGVLPHVVDVNDPALEDGPAGRGASVGAVGNTRLAASRSPVEALESTGSVNRCPSKRTIEPIAASHSLVALSTMASRAGCTSVSDLEMIRRISPVAVSRSSAFGQLSVPCLERLAQTLVLEGDRCLVGEGPEELDLLRRERPDARPPDDDEPDGGTIP